MATSIPGAYEEDPVVARITAQTHAREAKLTGSLHQAIDTNPDQYAGQRKVATQLGYPDAVVEAMPELAKQAQVQQITQSVADAPALKRKLADDEAFAKLAHDDTDSLSKVEGAVNFLGNSLKAGALDLIGAGAKLVDAVNPITLSPSDAAVLYKNDPRKLQDMQLNSPSMFLSRLANAMTDASSETMGNISPAAKQQYGDLIYQTTDPSKAAYLHPVKMIGDALRSLPTTAATAATIYLTRGAAGEAEAQALAAGLTSAEARAAAIAAASKTASLVGASSEGIVGYAQQANQTAQQAAAITDEALAQSPKYQELLASGYTPETAKAKLVADTAEQSGIIAGIVDAAVNAVGGHFLGKIIGEGGGVIKSAIGGLVNEGATEFVQSAGEQLGQNAVTRQNMDPSQSLSAGVVESALQGLFVGALTGGSMSGLHGVARHFEDRDRAAQQALQHREALGQLDQLSANSLLRSRDPATFQQFIASAMEDGPIQDVYIDAKTLQDSGIAEQLAQVSPAVREQFNEAASTGGSVRIPFDEYAANIAGTTLNQPLIDHIKLDPNGMTFAESEQYHQTYQEEFNKQVDQTIAAQQGDENFKAATAEVKGLIKEQLNTAGHTSPSANDAYASMVSAYYAVRAAQQGVSPKELYDQNPLAVTGERVAGEHLDQAATSANVGFEVAPDPNNAELNAQWNALTPQEKQQVSTAAAEKFVPSILNAIGTNGTFTVNTGSYLDETNPSLGLRIEDPSKVLEAGKALGVVFSQDGMLVTSDTPQEGLTQGFSMHVQLPQGFDQALVDKVYKILHAVTMADGSQPVQGQTTSPDGVMAVLNIPEWGGVTHDQFADVYAELAKALDASDLNLAYGLKQAYYATLSNGKDYEYARSVQLPDRPAGEKAGLDEARRYGDVQAEVNQHLADELARRTASTDRPAGNTQHLLNQSGAARGTYSPSENTISLLKNADLSTFLHELGHAFLEMDTQFATQILKRGVNTAGERQILADMTALMDWFRFEGDLTQQLAHWNSLSVNARRGHHEMFAEGFEAYLFTGKAPSLELQPLFQRFRAWLANVYRSLTSYLDQAGEKLTPEVRAVFDRMLATTEQIKEANQARGIAPLFLRAEEAGMSPEEFAKYLQDNVQSSQDAISDLEARSLKDMTWTSRLKERTVARLNKEAAALRKEVRKQVEAEVDQEPVYSAMRFLKRGETVGPNGEDIKADAGHRLSIAALQQLYPEGELANHPDWKKLGYGAYGMLSESGLHPDLVAEMFGYASGDDLVRSLLDAEPRNQVVEAVIDQRMLEQHGELSSPEAISKAADEAIHNDVRTRVIATELAGLQKALGSTLTLSRMAKDYARQVIGKTKVKDLRPNKYATDAARAGKQADAALRKGNREEAVIQKRNQLVNHTTTKAAYEAQAEISKTIQQFRKIATAKTDSLKNTHNMDLVNAARAVLAEYGVGPRAQNARDYIDLVKAYDPELYAALEPDIMQAQQNAKDIKELSVDELRALRDQVESLWYLSRREKQVEIDGKMVDRDEVVRQLGERLDELGIPDTVPGEGKAVTEAEKAKRTLTSFRAASRRVESWITRMDGGNIRGAFRRYTFTPISEAADNYRVETTRYIRAYRDLLKSIEPSLAPVLIAAPELGYTFQGATGKEGMSELLHAILHTGNESNKRKLLLGRGWATETEDGALNTAKWDRFVERMISEGRITKAHFDFAQGVWDLLEATKPLAQKTHREVFGRYFAEVTADSFTNQFGTYRGGYVPAVVDTEINQEQAINAANEAVNANNAYMFPATSRGFTKTRVEYNRPLALDLRRITQHIDKVLLFAHMERPVRDVTAVLRKSQTKLHRYDDVAYTEMLLPWLNRAAKQTVSIASTSRAGKAFDRALKGLRRRAGMDIMFFNMNNAFQQLTGFIPASLRVEPGHIKNALATYLQNPTETANAVATLSPFMQTRLDGQMFLLRNEIEALILNPSALTKASEWTQEHAYFMQQFAQNTVDIVVWKAAFNQAVAKDMGEVDAIRSANSVVRETQGSTNPEDISKVEASYEAIRLITQFTGYSNMLANLLGTQGALGFQTGNKRLLYMAVFGFLATSWVTEAINMAFHGGGDGDDDYLDEFLQIFVGAPFRSLGGMVPFVGPAVTTAVSSYLGKPQKDSLVNAPGVSSLESAARAPRELIRALFEDGSYKPAIRDGLTLLSLVTGSPIFSAIGRPLGYAADVQQGKVKPTGTLDAVRGGVTGYASADSRR